MRCVEARKRLSDYIDGILPAEEDALVRSHITVCPQCRAALSELEKTVAHLRNLEEVEPPAWLTQEVMAKIKEERRTEKGIWKKLFHPLYIKLPLEAVAAVLIAATALYLYTMNGGELKITGSRPLQVGEQSVPTENKASTRSAGTAGKTSRRELKNAPQKEPAAVALPHAPQAENEAASTPEESAESAPKHKVFASPKGVVPGPPAQAPSPAAKKSAAPTGAAAEYGGAVTPHATKEEAHVMRVVPSEKEAVTQGSTQGYALQKAEDAASSSRVAGEAVSFTLEVDDPVRAAEDFKKAVARLGGRIIATQAMQNGEVLTADLESQRIGKLFGELKTMGKIKQKEPPAGLKEGTITVRIEISEKP
jgi:hypothetical protein